MPLISRLIVFALGGALLSGCAANAAPLVPTGEPALNAPEPPARVVVPAPEQPTLPPVEEPPPAAETTTKPTRTAPPRPPVATTPPTEPPPPPVSTTPPPVLQTSANTAEFERRVRGQLTLAQTNLAQINPRNLGVEARAQYDAARGFIRQAEDALKVKNLVYAGQLADKAATMAALLRR